MDDALRRRARHRHGLLSTSEAALLPAGERRALVLLQPRVLVAGTQPLDLATVVAAVRQARPDVVLAGGTALWAYGVLHDAEVDVAVPCTRQVVLLPPARVRRLAPSLLAGVRTAGGHPVVALETALVQTAETRSDAGLVPLVEQVLRERRTTVDRLRRRCGRGVAGSTRLRRVVDALDDAPDGLPRLLRAALRDAGVRGLECEVRVVSASGEVAYLDLLHRPSRRALEVDGWTTHAARERFLADRRRDRWVLREHGVATTRIAAVEVRQRLPELVRELVALLTAPDL